MFHSEAEVIMINRNAEELEQKIGYSFKDKKLLCQALTHSSFSNEQKINKYESNKQI